MSTAYDFYFDRSRPHFVERRIVEKQRRQLELCMNAHRGVRRVLEIGPGEGWFARAALDAGLEYVAIEASETGAAHMRSDGFDVHVATTPPLPPGLGQFDLVYMSHVVEHLASPSAVLELLQQVGALLHPGGIVALAYPDARTLGWDFWDCDYTHRWPSTPRRVAQVTSDAGFTTTAEYRRCLHLGGFRGAMLRSVTRALPLRTLARVVPSRREWLLRAKMLFAPDVVTIVTPMEPPSRPLERAA
jgi:SAM-dependent methyltransferase